MKFRITKQQLLAQLPEGCGYSMLQALDEMPPFFIFDGIEVIEGDSKYEHLFERFTPTERHILMALESGKGKWVTRTALLSSLYRKREGLYPKSDMLAVFIKQLRKKIPKDLKIETRFGVKRLGLDGGYRLIEK